jgi:5,6-dimethylbenzimidazole synthase
MVRARHEARTGRRDPGTASTDDAANGPSTDAVTVPGFYDVVHSRRDVRAEFSGGPVDEAVLARILGAAHSAPSVGLSQPWDFVLVSDHATRRAFWEHVQSERSTFAASLEKDRAERFAGIKIDGILEASLSVVVTYDAARGAPGVLGRHAIADAGLYSVCLAIENMWLACTAEGWGMGWVSFYREAFLRELIGIPHAIRPVAWLCIGPVTRLQDTPDLERHGWRSRTPLGDALHLDRWDGRHADALAVAAASRAAGETP